MRHVRGRHAYLAVPPSCWWLSSPLLSWSSMPTCVMSKCVMSIEQFLSHVYSTWLFIFLCLYGMLLCYNSQSIVFSCVLNLVMFIKVMVLGPTLASYTNSTQDRVVRGVVPCTHKSSNLIVLTAYSSFPAPQTLSTFPAL